MKLKISHVLLGFLALGLIYNWAVGPAKPADRTVNTVTATAPVVPGERTVGRTHFGCTTPEIYQGALKFPGDERAFISYMTRYYNQCERFDAGETVIVTDVGVWSGLLKIRKPGDSRAYWTTIRIDEVR